MKLLFLMYLSFSAGAIDRQADFSNAQGQVVRCAAKDAGRVDSTLSAISYYRCGSEQLDAGRRVIEQHDWTTERKVIAKTSL